jgi:hypothetical protein
MAPVRLARATNLPCAPHHQAAAGHGRGCRGRWPSWGGWGGGWLGRSPGRARGGCGAGQIAQVGGHGAEVAVPSGHVRVVGTVGGRVEVQPRHGCGCATAKAPGREPRPCCWPPRVPDSGNVTVVPWRDNVTVVPWRDNSPQFCGGATPRAKAPRTAIEFVEPVDKRGCSRRAAEDVILWPAERSPRGDALRSSTRPAAPRPWPTTHAWGGSARLHYRRSRRAGRRHRPPGLKAPDDRCALRPPAGRAGPATARAQRRRRPPRARPLRPRHLPATSEGPPVSPRPRRGRRGRDGVGP